MQAIFMKSFLTRHSWLLFVFLCTLAFIAPVSIAFTKVMSVLVVPTFMVVYRQELKIWLREHIAERCYLKGVLLFGLFVFIQVAIWSLLPNKYGYKPSYSALEESLLAYIFIPLLALVMGVGLTQKMFERAIMAFGLCTALGGILLLYLNFDMSQLLNSPTAFFSQVMECRFLGCEGKFPHLKVFLKDYSFYPTLGSLLLIPLVLKRKGAKRWLLVLLSALNALFLLFTNNKGTMVGFSAALVLMAVYFTRELAWRKRVFAALCIAAAMVLVVVVLPQSVKERFCDVVSESKAFVREKHDSGSTSIRLTIWKIQLSHVKEFWLFGEGSLYATNRLRAYLVEANYQNYVNAGYIYHNQYLAYFHAYGLIGLLFLLFLLFYPLYAMLRYRNFSMMLTTVIVVFAIALMEDRYLGKDMVAALLFMLYFSFFQVDKWRFLENKTSE